MEVLFGPTLFLNSYSLGPINDLLSWSGWTPIAKVINTCLYNAIQYNAIHYSDGDADGDDDDKGTVLKNLF